MARQSVNERRLARFTPNTLRRVTVVRLPNHPGSEAGSSRPTAVKGAQVMNEIQRAVGHNDHWQRRTILVVDDEAGMRSFLSRALEGNVARVVTELAPAKRIPC